MNASTLAFVAALIAFLVFAGGVAMALLPFIQHVNTVLPR